MKKNLIIVLFSLFNLSVFAQNYINTKSIVAYRNAKNSFENQDYGKALNYAEDAILYRKTQIEQDYNFIQNSLSSKQVKKAGDNIDDIIKVLTQRDEYECIELIKYYNNKGNFENSISNVLNYIKSQEQYPEAQKLIGDIYKLEGEYTFAEEYYLKALENSSVLDIPDEKYEIIYMLADLSRLQGDDNKTEIRLLNIIEAEQNEKNTILTKSMKNTVSKNNEQAIEKFFTMYRSDNYYCLKAYSDLAEFYLSKNELNKAFDYSALCVITGFSKIYDVIEKRDIAFAYENLSDFLDQIPNYSDVVQWGSDNYVWKSFNQFCEICEKCGYDIFSIELLKILAIHSPEKYWQQNAVLKLDKIDGIKNPEK